MSEFTGTFTPGIDDYGRIRDPVDLAMFHKTIAGPLPRTWRSARLEEVSLKITDGTHESVVTVDYQSNTVPFLYVSCIEDNGIKWDEAARIPFDLYKLISQGRAPISGMILYTAVGSYGRATLIKGKRDFAFQRHIACIYPNASMVDASFMALWLNGAIAKRYAASVAIGNAQKTVTLRALAHFPIALPPRGEQQRISEILSAADEAIRSTEQLISKLEQAKQGFIHDLLAHSTSNVSSPTALGDVSVIAGGVTLGRTISGSGSIELPYLRVANVQDGYVDDAEMKVVRVLRTEVARYLLRTGDVLMTEGGDFDKLGRGAVWDGRVDPCLHQNHIFRVRCDPSSLLPEFLAIYSASPAGRRHFGMLSKQTTNLASINMTQLKAFPIPVPPLREQSRIVGAVQAQADDINREQQTLAKLKFLKQGLTDDLLTGRVRAGALGE
jgi:type I restriction enzyme S subunit